MRFKAKLTNDQLSIFHGVISPMSKLQDPSSSSTSSRFAVLYLDQEYVRISCKSIDITCFAELSQKELFLEHRIESAADNVIVLQIDLVSLKVALQSVVQSNGGGGYHRDAAQHLRNSYSYRSNSSHHSTSAMHTLYQQQQVVVMKLAKRNKLPCLCLEGRSSAAAEKDVEIYQAIPVLIMRQSEMQHHLPPQINLPQVQLELPSAPPIRALVDKLKGMSKHVLLEGSMKGDLTIRIDQDGASLACFYNHLIPRWPQEQQDEEEGDDRDNRENASASSCILKLDAQKLSTCLQWQQHQLPMASCLLGMVYNEMLVLHVLTCPEQVGFFTYYLPVCFLQEEDLV